MADDPCILIDGLFVYIDIKQKMQVQEKEEESLNIESPTVMKI
jgi:hypothetical protein